MPQHIDIPGQGIIEFPDGMSDDQITAAIHTNFGAPPPQSNSAPSPASDAASSLAGGIERGAAAMPMVLPNLINQAVAGPQYLGRGIAEGVDKLAGIQPQPRGPIWQPFYSSEDALQSLPDSLQPHNPQTAGGVGADIAGQLIGNALSGKAINKANQSIGNVLADQQSGKPAEAPTITAGDVRAKAAEAYAKAESVGGTYSPKVTDSIIESAKSVLPQTPAGMLTVGESPAGQLAQRWEELRGQPLSLKSAMEMDQGLGQLADTQIDVKTGKPTAEGNKFLQIQQRLRDLVSSPNPEDVSGGSAGIEASKDARDLWATQARMGDVERIIQRANMMDHPVTSLKSGFRNLYNNPGRMRGFTPDEASAIKLASDTGVVSNALRLASSGLIPIIAGAGGGGWGGAGVGYGVNLGAKAMASALQNNRANNVLDLIANRPVVQNAFGMAPPPSQPGQPIMPPLSASLLAAALQKKN